MQFPASTILSFVTGRLYSTMPPTVLFADLLAEATGEKKHFADELPNLKEKFGPRILAQCPKEFQKICTDWKHTDDWQERIELIDNAFGLITISYCG